MQDDLKDFIKQSGIGHEFRTTCVPSLVDEQDITEISQLIGRQISILFSNFNR